MYQDLSEEKKNKKQQYGNKRQKHFSGEEKQRKIL